PHLRKHTRSISKRPRRCPRGSHSRSPGVGILPTRPACTWSILYLIYLQVADSSSNITVNVSTICSHDCDRKRTLSMLHTVFHQNNRRFFFVTHLSGTLPHLCKQNMCSG
uniref:Uncharacterized protein n=1 Tax=Oryzias latipes TaxID=8090 RepID=A0A3P9J2L4_ORYLA